MPTLYASQGYDTALLIDAAVREVKGKIEDGEALRKALTRRQVRRRCAATFKFNNNQYPIQDYYLRVVGQRRQGRRMINKTIGTVISDHRTSTPPSCTMK